MQNIRSWENQERIREKQVMGKKMLTFQSVNQTLNSYIFYYY